MVRVRASDLGHIFKAANPVNHDFSVARGWREARWHVGETRTTLHCTTFAINALPLASSAPHSGLAVAWRKKETAHLR